ncbi:2-oxoacid:acceptor oxidoreductase subunit alpha [Candidatus Parcubacteria bacterium]|nr:2-oxoacid:acceptor oxidoreductase subunit alpha [Candidatus Parcubacteria bacterium]
MQRLSIKITGPAGFGIKVTGIMLAKIFIRKGLNVFAHTEYPSLIRGGHNTYQIDISDRPVNSSKEKCDILIALDKKSIDVETRNLNKNGIILYDEETQKHKNTKTQKQIQYIQVPFLELAKQAGGEIMKNTVAVGALLGILNLKLDEFNNILKQEFKDKKGVGEKNILAAELGKEFVEKKSSKWENNGILSPAIREGRGRDDRVLMTGNQTSAMATIASQCQVYVAYPMTPATDILHILEAKQKETGMLVHQPEDEIAGIHVALGASFSGARSATGTSGGGFALMNEGLSLAGMLELPLVLFEVQRPGPATGNPTWTEQGDLNYVINAGHGEFPKIVITPGTPEQVFSLVQNAFNLSDKFQTPVIVLTDKHLGESSFTVDKDVFNKIEKINRGKMICGNVPRRVLEGEDLFARYKFEKDGVSWRTIPGVSGGEHFVTGVEHHENGIRCGEYIANSDEHNEVGFSNELSETRKKMMDKRMNKLEEIRKEIPLPKIYGPKSADKTLVCWGSTFGACYDAIQENKKANLIHFEYVWPMPKGLDKFLAKFKKLVLVENNKTAQLGKLIRQETGIEIKDKILKYDSRPFWTEEIL